MSGIEEIPRTDVPATTTEVHAPAPAADTTSAPAHATEHKEEHKPGFLHKVKCVLLPSSTADAQTHVMQGRAHGRSPFRALSWREARCCRDGTRGAYRHEPCGEAGDGAHEPGERGGVRDWQCPYLSRWRPWHECAPLALSARSLVISWSRLTPSVLYNV
ncbi:hypothetical protein PENSPDRAFT_114259 [Peniophora sp. CONT]|nr:hypothetical protein PENSPDRAFT_114259 [Peniophora sp. CONT]